MSEESDGMGSLVLEGRVKLHVFEPSRRRIWTVVGRGEERWVDPEGIYCSCPGFYFGRLHGQEACYHLDLARLALAGDMAERTVFTDEEFSDFLLGLLQDL